LNVDLVFQDAAKATPLIAGRYYGLCVDMDGPVLFSDLIARFAGFAGFPGFAGFALNML
jgi:hypothetical protein